MLWLGIVQKSKINKPPLTGENNMGTLIVSLILITIVAAVIFSMIKSKRAGRHPSCGGNCAACGGACHACTNKSVKKS